MTDNNYYDLFISHYQYNGGALALNINLLLEKKNPNLKIFLDVNSDMKKIHNLENFIKKSKNILLIITENVFERYFVQLELKAALKYNKNIITVWDKDRCQEFPKKENIPNYLIPILDIKAINWISEKRYRDIVIEEIIENMVSDNENLSEFYSKMVYLILHEKELNLQSNEINPKFKNYCLNILTAVQLTESTIYFALKYVYDIKKLNPELNYGYGSEYRISVVALIIASKFLYGNINNKKWSDISDMKLQELNIMELEFLNALNFKLFINDHDFKKWKCILDSYHDKNNLSDFNHNIILYIPSWIDPN